MPVKPRNRSSYKSASLQSTDLPTGAVDQKPTTAIRLNTVRWRFMALEFISVASSAFIASILYHSAIIAMTPPVLPYGLAAIFIGALVWAVSTAFQHFDSMELRPLHLLLWSGVGAVGLAFSLLLSIMFLLKIEDFYSRGTFIFQLICVSATVIIFRAMTYSWIRASIASGTLQARHVIMIGSPAHCTKFSQRLKASAIQSVASFRLPWPKPTGDRKKVIDDDEIYKLIEACRAVKPDDIIILANQEDLPKTMDLASSLAELPAGLHIIPVDALELLAGSQVTEFGNLLTIQVHSPPLTPFDLAVKRSFDLLASTFGMIVLSPLFLFVAIAIKIDSPGPVLFRQARHGFNNDPIQVIKFRTMTTLESGENFTQAVKDDPRVTRLGRLLRQTNIDELPQLINVLQGNMSIVGPRPHATAHNRFFQSKIAPFSRRHTVKPGLTGWAQVNGLRGETDTLEKMQRRIEHDLYYIDNWSFLLDMKIILLTMISKKAYTNAF
jgi:Undecaprenyl-phosphate glucose phosphotransferase